MNQTGKRNALRAGTAASLVAQAALTGCSPTNSPESVDTTPETSSQQQTFSTETSVEMPDVDTSPFSDIEEVSTQRMFNSHGEFDYSKFNIIDPSKRMDFRKYMDYVDSKAEGYSQIYGVDENVIKALVSSIVYEKLNNWAQIQEGDDYASKPTGPMQIVPKYCLNSFNENFGTSYSAEDIYRDENLAIELGVFHLLYPVKDKSAIVSDSNGNTSLGKVLSFFYGGGSVADNFDPNFPLVEQDIPGWAQSWLFGIENHLNSVGISFSHSPLGVEPFEGMEFVIDEPTATEKEPSSEPTPTPGSTSTPMDEPTQIPPTATPFMPQEPTPTKTQQATPVQEAVEKSVEVFAEVNHLDLSNFYEDQAGLIEIDYEIYSNYVNEEGNYNYAYFIQKFPHFPKLIPYIEKHSKTYSEMYGIDQNFLRVFFSSVYATESSGGNPDEYVSSTGCLGVGQVSWESHGPDFNKKFGTSYTEQDLFNDDINIKISMWAYLRYYNNLGRVFYNDGEYPSIESLSHKYKHGFTAYTSNDDDLMWFVIMKRHLEGNGISINYGNFLDPYDISADFESSRVASNLQRYGFTPLEGLSTKVVEDLKGRYPDLTVVSLDTPDGGKEQYLLLPAT